MVNRKLIAIAYFCFFIGVYLSSIVYGMLPQVSDNINIKKLPQTTYTLEVGSVANAMNMTSSWVPLIMIVIFAIVTILFGCINTFHAY